MPEAAIHRLLVSGPTVTRRVDHSPAKVDGDHRAFDSNILGITPHYDIEIRHDILEEIDPPTLQHALQGLHGEMLTIPRRKAERPRPDLLEERYEEFRAAG